MEPENNSSNVQQPPSSFAIGDDLEWSAPWIDVSLWVELPFWLMTDNATVPIEVKGHEFQIALHENYFELHVGQITDSRRSVVYRGPLKKLEELSEGIQELRNKRPDLPLMWRKCKTIVKIATRCNEQIWDASFERAKLRPATIEFYKDALCRAHIPVLNKLIQEYRLATYDYFAFELAPWDVPAWQIEREGQSVTAHLVPYRRWDFKPQIYESGTFSFQPPVGPAGTPVTYRLISPEDLRKQLSTAPSPGEFELLDALNLMERGDYSGAVRRVTTAIEAVIEAVVGREIEAINGKPSAEKFLKATETKFYKRVAKYETLSGRALSVGLRKNLNETRQLRHKIVHKGYRIAPGERGRAQRSIDTGRWIYNWFENDSSKRDLREKRIAFRSLGRDHAYGIFPTEITPDGVVVSGIV
jgi:hypothetical protein